MAEAKKEVVEVEATSTAIALAAMYEDDAGGGFEQADKDAYAIPFLSILQSERLTRLRWFRLADAVQLHPPNTAPCFQQ